MPNTYGLQPTFSGGELSPGLQGRVDLAKYATGLNKCLNATIHPQGGVSNRSGFKYISRPKYPDKKCRLHGFEFSATQVYMLEIGDLYARFYFDGGQIEIDEADVDNFDPTISYVAGDFAKVGCWVQLDTEGTKKLWVYAPYGGGPTTTTVGIETNSIDTLAVTYAAPVLTIKLANTTPAKNTAALIQAAIRAVNVAFAAWYVKENTQYLIARSTAIATIAPIAVTLADTVHYKDNIGSGEFPTIGWPVQSIYEVALPYTEAELPHVKFAQSADVLYMAHPDHPPMTLTRFDHTDWRKAEFPFAFGPFQPANVTTTTISADLLNAGDTATLTPSVAGLFDIDDDGSLLEIDHDLPSQTISGAFGGNGSSATIRAMGAWRLITHGTWTGKITVEKSLNGVGAWTEIRAFTSTANFNANTFGTDDNDGSAALYRVTFSGWVSGSCEYDFTLDACTVRGVILLDTASATVLGVVIRALGSTAATPDWARASWSVAAGWPSAVAFFGDRLGFGNTATEPQTAWLSKTGEYTNFGTSDPLVDDDSISVNLPSRKLNGIETMVPLGELLILTRSSEASIGSGGEAMTPTTVTAKMHGFRGTNGVDVCVIGNRAVYVQPQGTVMRDIGFDFSSQSYTGDDISLISSHLFKDYEIVDLCYQQEPDSLIWAIRNDGGMLSATYLREEEVLAWSRHNTDGLFEAVATIPGDGYDQLWVVTKRGDDRFIELQAQRMVTEQPEDQFFVDCGITYEFTGPRIGDVAADASFPTPYQNRIQVEKGFLANGDLVVISGLTTFTELNGNIYRVEGFSDDLVYDTFYLADPNTGDPSVTRSALTQESSFPATYFANVTVTVPTDVVSGLDHLEGRTVAILADGIDLPQQVVTGGEITLPTPAYVVHVGLPYVTDIETLRIEVAGRDGTLQGRKSRVSNVTTRFYRSRGGMIGPDEDHLYDVDFSPLLLSVESPLDLLSGDVPHTLAADWDNGGRMFYRQNKPLPVTILAFMPALTVGG